MELASDALLDDMAAILLDLAEDHGPVVPRAAVRRAWAQTYPEQRHGRRIATASRLRNGRVLAGKGGTEASNKVGRLLKKLEGAGLVVRDGETVHLLDVPGLTARADSA